MKKILFIAISLLFAQLAAGQVDPVNEMFDKYSGQEGVTTIFISSRMFRIMAGVELDDENINDLMTRLKSIRILTVNDSILNSRVNFYKELESMMSFDSYEELMVVRDGGTDLKFLVKGRGDRIDELLMIGGGNKDGNVMISIRGDLNMDNISDISRGIGISELEELEKNRKKD
ncbi:MAG: DUF4252 domain-containing protein [Bacteroidales bacterium]|nr:DUF4252 domain-containing protein [Bacteroidales bacterium]